MNTQKTWWWIFFGSFMLWPKVIIPKITTLSKGPEPRPLCIIFCFTSHPCASCYHHFCLHQWVPPATTGWCNCWIVPYKTSIKIFSSSNLSAPPTPSCFVGRCDKQKQLFSRSPVCCLCRINKVCIGPWPAPAAAALEMETRARYQLLTPVTNDQSFIDELCSIKSLPFVSPSQVWDRVWSSGTKDS